MKLILGFIIVTAIAALVIALYCALIIACRYDEYENNGDNNEWDDDMSGKKQICPRCKTGRDAYDLDSKSVMCPNISCWKNGKCRFYVSLEKTSKLYTLGKDKKEENIRSYGK